MKRSHHAKYDNSFFFFGFLLLRIAWFYFLRLVYIQILVHRHISLNVTNYSNYSDEVQG